EANESNVLVAKPDLASFKLTMLDPAMHQTARIDFRHLVAMNYAGDMCTLGVWRDGAAIPGGVQVQLSAPKQLVPVHREIQKRCNQEGKPKRLDLRAFNYHSTKPILLCTHSKIVAAFIF
ncbi:hypothetical protein DUNSADRAFT_8758, partial [Dunaliella salina]